MLIVWEQQYSVGVAELDNQHQRLIDLINELHDAMKQAKGATVVRRTIEGLVDYTRTHFAYEEGRLRELGYPELVAHNRVHAAFITQVANFKTRYESGKEIITVDMLDFLKKWLVDHIMGTDKKYMAFFNSKGVY